MSGTVLLVAYHFPPCGGSSGLQRTLAFARHLRAHGWRPIVLTACPDAYERTSDHQLADIPADVFVARTWAADASKAFAVRGRYWSRLAIPDRWTTWWVSAVPTGLQLIRKHHVDVIWSTYPIATAHRIGATLSKLSGVPWVADFRDPMVERHPETGSMAPANPVLRNARLKIERSAVERARKLVFCTQGARDIVSQRYPKVESSRLAIVSNGYEESIFGDLPTVPLSTTDGRKVLLHSGTIYLSEDRDPTALFRALETLRKERLIDASSFELRLRDPSCGDRLVEIARGTGVEDLVTILPSMPYRDALHEMMSVDGLLVLQGITSNPAVPAKLYEYLRARRPILPLVHPAGETARTLQAAGINRTAPLTDSTAIAELLRNWIKTPSAPGWTADDSTILNFSREALTGCLAGILEEVRQSDGRAF